jgi:diguanylate cyclase (GGDEF)-like protein
MACNAVADAIATGRPFEFTARVLWADGTVLHVLTRGYYLPDPPGAPACVFGVIIDVTDQKQIQSLLAEAKATAEAANLALEEANRALHALALQDALTGLSNRRHFDRALDQEFRRSVRAGIPLGMILLDVDKFKQFNDLYGHQAGDACLQAIARSIPPLLNRPGDIAARYGGEEIALLLPGTTLAGARGLAERVAFAVRKLAIPHAGSAHSIVTISAGVEAFVPVRDVDTAALLVEHADLALYAAKRAGRDTVMNFHECAAEAGVKVFEQ